MYVDLDKIKYHELGCNEKYSPYLYQLSFLYFEFLDRYSLDKDRKLVK